MIVTTGEKLVKFKKMRTFEGKVPIFTLALVAFILDAVMYAVSAQKDATLGEQTLVGFWLFIPVIFVWFEKIGPNTTILVSFTALALLRNQWVRPEKDCNWVLHGPKKTQGDQNNFACRAALVV